MNMSNIVIFGSTQSGKTTLLGYLSTAMLRNPQFNAEVYQNLKLIKRLTVNDEFNIGDPHNPTKVNKGVIFPSFVSLDKNELNRFRGQNTEGTTKRLHRKKLTICTTENHLVNDNQDENENIMCTFVDVPGFRQRLSDKYRGFFEGDIGIAVLKITELIELYDLIVNRSSEDDNYKIDTLIGRLFEPIRVWCDYRSPSSIIIAISQIDLVYDNKIEKSAANGIQIEHIKNAINCINLVVDRFNKGISIPITPISINLETSENKKKFPPMRVFFYRKAENIYFEPTDKKLPGSGTLISCLNRILASKQTTNDTMFSMASVNKVMKAIVSGSPKPSLNVHAIHGSIHITDKIILGPVIDKATNEIVYVESCISSIKADGATNTSETLLRGNVGGIILFKTKNIETGKEYLLSYDSKESDISILKSTIIFSGSIAEGDIVEVVIDKSDYINTNNTIDEIYSRVIPSIMPFDEIFLFWYGKKISVNIVEIVFNDDQIKVSVIPSKNEKHLTGVFALPSENDTLKYKDNVLLAIPRAYYSTLPLNEVQGKFTYISCSISSIKKYDSFNQIGVETCGNIKLENIFDDKLSWGYMDISHKKIWINIYHKKGDKRTDIFSLYKKISKNIKDWYNHRSYSLLGGLNIYLLNNGKE